MFIYIAPSNHKAIHSALQRKKSHVETLNECQLLSLFIVLLIVTASSHNDWCFTAVVYLKWNSDKQFRANRSVFFFIVPGEA